MKKLTLLFAVLTFNAMAQIPNGGFEAWSQVDEQLEPDEWITSNWMTSMFGVISAEQGSPAPQGSHFVSLTTNEVIDGNMPGFALSSFAYAARPTTFDGQVRYSTSSTDPAMAIVYFTHWDENAQMQDVIGMVEMQWTGNMMTWQAFSGAFEYNSNATPDSAHIILLSSSADEPSLGNNIGFDALSFSSNVGVREIASVDLELFPIPTADMLTLSAGSTIRDVHILSAEGRSISDHTVNSMTTTLNVAELNSGIYFARVSMADGTMGVHRFVKQ